MIQMPLRKLPPEVVSILEKRLNDEYYASYFYKAAANFCKNAGYFGGEKYFSHEAQEELEHAKKIEDFMTGWNINPQLFDVNVPEQFVSLPQLIADAYNLELTLFDEYEKNSREVFVQSLVAFDLLAGFRDIQNASVAQYSDLINQLNLLDPNKFSLFYFDKEVLGKG